MHASLSQSEMPNGANAMTGTERTLPAEKRDWYDWIVTVLASVVVVFIWKFAAWGATFLPWISMNQDQWFVMFVATSLALHLHTKRHAS
jgi:hypothetical protein